MFADYILLPILMFSPISDVSSSLSLSLLAPVFKFPRINELGSSTLLLGDIAYEKTPLSLGEFNKNLGLFLIHQEIDSAQASRNSYLNSSPFEQIVNWAAAIQNQ